MVKWPASPVRGGRIREKGEMIDVSTMENLPGRSLMEIRASLGVHIRMAAESCILAGQDLLIIRRRKQVAAELSAHLRGGISLQLPDDFIVFQCF